jgi:hypothetical protein
METSSNTLKWALSEFIHHLEIMKGAHEKLHRVLGKNRVVIALDLPSLPCKPLSKKPFIYTLQFLWQFLTIISKIVKF